MVDLKAEQQAEQIDDQKIEQKDEPKTERNTEQKTDQVQGTDCIKAYGDRAKALFEEGYNCAQSVVLAFSEEMGMDKDTVARLSSSFGGGLGRLREVCGCVSGMAIVCGALEGYASPNAKEAKAEHYARVQSLAGAFKERNGSYICRELLSGLNVDNAPVPEERTKAYYEKRPCSELVACAAELLAEHFYG